MNEIKIAIIGLGYVGLPLAHLFATKYPVIGFDINKLRIQELRNGMDHTLEISYNALKKVTKEIPDVKIGLFCTDQLEHIKQCNYYIVTVPTPVDTANKPDLTAFYRSSETIGKL